MNHLLTAELFRLERAELARRLRRERPTATVPAARHTPRHRATR
ncbi:hypothetical protein AB0C02_29365 [Micromonospora sp. NPDC048999]